MSDFHAPLRRKLTTPEFIKSFLAYARAYREENPGALERLMTLNQD